MSVTLATLRARTRLFLNDKSNDWSSDSLNIYLDEAQREVAAYLAKNGGDFLLREATASLIEGQTDYPYPSDIFGRNIRALYTYSSEAATQRYKVELGTLEQVYDKGLSRTQYPQQYCCLDGYFKIGPPPDGSGYRLRIAYIRQPTTFESQGNSDSATMDLDDEFKELISCTAALLALEPMGGDFYVLVKARQGDLLLEAARLIHKEDLMQAYPAWTY